MAENKKIKKFLKNILTGVGAYGILYLTKRREKEKTKEKRQKKENAERFWLLRVPIELAVKLNFKRSA